MSFEYLRSETTVLAEAYGAGEQAAKHRTIEDLFKIWATLQPLLLCTPGKKYAILNRKLRGKFISGFKHGSAAV